MFFKHNCVSSSHARKEKAYIPAFDRKMPLIIEDLYHFLKNNWVACILPVYSLCSRCYFPSSLVSPSDNHHAGLSRGGHSTCMLCRRYGDLGGGGSTEGAIQAQTSRTSPPGASFFFSPAARALVPSLPENLRTIYPRLGKIPSRNSTGSRCWVRAPRTPTHTPARALPPGDIVKGRS